MANSAGISVGLNRVAWAREAMIVLAASMLIAAGAWLRVEGVIPFSMQSFAVLLIAGVLGGKRAFAAVVAYLIEGAAGLPVFAGGPAGIIHFAGHTTGYLVGFAIAAYVIGSMIERRNPQSGVKLSIAFFVGHIIILAAGLLWLVPFVGIQGAFATGVAPFLLTAILKSMLAAMAVPPAMRIIGCIA